ncbi:MAG: hypothetical protein P8074_07465 [Anaerolineales bacterium]|jgi:hypothetical protein
MRHHRLSIAAIRWLFGVLAGILMLSACSPPASPAPTRLPLVSASPATALQRITPTAQKDAFSDLPDAARVATHPGEPRPAAYWALWNTCAPQNRATQAAANGGRQAGWILLDDLIVDPGIQLGDHPITSCQEGLALLQGLAITGENTGDPVYELAGALLAAELNLNIGAETCPIAEEAVLGSHLILSQIGFGGAGEYAASASNEVTQAIPRLVELLKGYNHGELCR